MRMDGTFGVPATDCCTPQLHSLAAAAHHHVALLPRRPHQNANGRNVTYTNRKRSVCLRQWGQGSSISLHTRSGQDGRAAGAQISSTTGQAMLPQSNANSTRPEPMGQFKPNQPVPCVRDRLPQDALTPACDCVTVADERLRRRWACNEATVCCSILRGKCLGGRCAQRAWRHTHTWPPSPSVSHVSDLMPEGKKNSGGLTSICCRSMSLSPLAWSSRLDST